LLTSNSFHKACQAVNQAYYVEILKQLCEAVHRKGPELWPSDWILHHGSAPVHRVLSVKHFLAQTLITEMEHTPFSLSLNPHDFWLFQKIKTALKGQFEDIEDV
jgi:hypothetical protein